jgi:hypothetical protein
MTCASYSAETMCSNYSEAGKLTPRTRALRWLASLLTSLRQWCRRLTNPEYILQVLWRLWKVLASYVNKNKAHRKYNGLDDQTSSQVAVSTVCASRIPEHLRGESPVTITVIEGSDGEQTSSSTLSVHSVNPLTLPLPTSPRPSSSSHSFQAGRQFCYQGSSIHSHSTPHLPRTLATVSRNSLVLSRTRPSLVSSRVSGRTMSLRRQTSAASSLVSVSNVIICLLTHSLQ